MKIIVAILAIAFILSGCAAQLSPEAKKQLQDGIDKQALAMQKMQQEQAQFHQKLAGDLENAALKGQQAPASNPIAATDDTVKELHPWLFYGAIGFFVLAVYTVAMSAVGPIASTVGWLAWMKPVGEICQVVEPCAVRAFCITFAALMLLPFIKVSAICGIVAIVLLFIYEMVINKGNLQTVIASMVRLVTGVGGDVSVSNVSTGAIK